MHLYIVNLDPDCTLCLYRTQQGKDSLQVLLEAPRVVQRVPKKAKVARLEKVICLISSPISNFDLMFVTLLQAGKTHSETTARSAVWLPRNIKFVASFHHRWSDQCSQGNKGREGCGTRWDLPRHVEEHRASCDPMAAGFLRWCGDNSKD